MKDNIVGGPAIIFHRYHEKDVTKIRGGGETCRSIVGYDANALYLWALMQDMPTGWYVRRREENKFRPQQAQPYGQMAIQWLTHESERTVLSIRHQANGREKRIGKLPIDGWCAKTRTAYQFHECFWHGCPKCHTTPRKRTRRTTIPWLSFWPTRKRIRHTFDDMLKLSKCGSARGNANETLHPFKNGT